MEKGFGTPALLDRIQIKFDLACRSFLVLDLKHTIHDADAGHRALVRRGKSTRRHSVEVSVILPENFEHAVDHVLVRLLFKSSLAAVV